MFKVWLIIEKELALYFKTWLGYITVFITLIINGILFNTFAIGNKPKFSAEVLKDFFYFASGMAIVTSIFLAMRLVSGESENKTLSLYFSAPISDRQIIYGKFLSAFFVLVIIQLLTVYIPSLIYIEGKVSIGHMVAGYCGIFLLGGSVLAISIFGSVIAPNQVLSGIVGGGITVIFLTLWLLANRVDSPFREILFYMSIHNQRFQPFSRGVIHLRNIIYYLSVTCFFLECSIRYLGIRRKLG